MKSIFDDLNPVIVESLPEDFVMNRCCVFGFYNKKMKMVVTYFRIGICESGPSDRCLSCLKYCMFEMYFCSCGKCNCKKEQKHISNFSVFFLLFCAVKYPLQCWKMQTEPSGLCDKCWKTFDGLRKKPVLVRSLVLLCKK